MPSGPLSARLVGSTHTAVQPPSRTCSSLYFNSSTPPPGLGSHVLLSGGHFITSPTSGVTQCLSGCDWLSLNVLSSRALGVHTGQDSCLLRRVVRPQAASPTRGP